MGTRFVGKNCSVTFGTAMKNVLGWTFNANCEMADSSAANATGTNDGKIYLAGYKSYTATVNTYNAAVSGNCYHCAKGTTTTLQLYRKSGSAASGYYEGTAICNNIETGAEMRGCIPTTYQFQFTGAVTFKTT